MMSEHHGGMGMDMGSMHMGMGIFLMLIHLLIVVGIIYWIAKVVVSKELTRRNADSRAVNLLAERYVQGEITEEEYKRMSEVLRQ